ncbi:hypothetical protein F183_A44340 [Bryobacterales bacterium F-183]|nr:hypothetical protein F183_A44340 [Bryobacterales bacterium F-183]
MDLKSFTDRDLVVQAHQKTEGCLSIAQLETAAAGTPLGDDAAQQHLAACPHCQSEAALMAEYLNAAPVNAEEVAAVKQIEHSLTSHPSWRPGSKPVAWWKTLFAKPTGQLAAAGLASVLALAVYLGAPGRDGRPVVVENDTVRSTSIEGVEPVGDISQPPQILRWRAAAGPAAGYRVRILDVDNVAIWQASAKSNQVEIPASARALMLHKKTLFWQIDALDAKGATLAQSVPSQFRVVVPNSGR